MASTDSTDSTRRAAGSARRLVVLKVSPWSERARWALDHHRLSYREVQHVPFLGERRLRRLVGRRKERATVPVLVAGPEVLTDSWDIALHADREGQGSKLIPAEREAEIRQWTRRADEAMEAGRALVTAAMLASPEAIDETLPPEVPAWLRRLLRPVGRYATTWFARKYDLRLDGGEGPRQKMRAGLDALREALSAGAERGAAAGRPGYVLGEFSYADIAMASCLQGVSPVDDRYLPLGPATRRAWTNADLAKEYGDLIAWRDRLYEEHRR